MTLPLCILPMHQEDYGPSWVVEKRKQEAQEAAVAHAFVRLRRRKPPYPIHRRYHVRRGRGFSFLMHGFD